MRASGYVEAVSAKTTSKAGKVFRSPLYSFLVNEEWYGCGFDNPNVEQGDMIDFTFVQGARGKDVEVSSINKGIAQAVSPAEGAGTQPVNIDNRQLSIVFQSSRKDAIQVITAAAAAGYAKIPKTNSYEVFLDLIDDLTQEFCHAALVPVLEPKQEVQEEVINDE